MVKITYNPGNGINSHNYFGIPTFLYLLNWNKSFDIETLQTQEKLMIKDNKEEWELLRILRHRYYELRTKSL